MRSIILCCCLLVGAFTCEAKSAEAADEEAGDIRAMLNESAEAWNRGDLEGFMESYWNSPQLRFASGDTVHRGWQATLDRYRRRYGEDRESMGRLAFTDTEITMLAKDAAIVFGRYHLAREDGRATGLFTLTVRKMDESWRIVQDHTSTGREP